MPKITINKILKKKNKTPITCLTAYSKNIAKIADKYCDLILVGDSLGMVLYGMKTTRDIKINTMILHGKAVKTSTKKSLVVFDMPYKTYTNKFIAYKNAKKVMKLTKCDAVKLEGGKKIVNIIKYLTKKKIPVMGHVGLLPQTSINFKIKGKNSIQTKQILEDAKAVSKSGVFAIIIECVVEKLAKDFPKQIIGIKDSTYNLYETVKIPNFLIFPGSETKLLNGLELGNSGIISAICNVTAPLSRKVYDDFYKQKKQTSNEKLCAIRRVFDSYNLISGLHSFMSVENEKYKKVLPPLSLLSNMQQKELIDKLKKLKFFPEKNIAA